MTLISPITSPLACLATLFIAATSVCHADAMPIRAGQWEITVKLDMPGMPVVPQPMTISNCVTEEQIKNPEAAMASLNSPREGGGNCKVGKYKLDGKIATWTMNCTGVNTMKGEGRITFDNADAYHGTVKMQMTGPQGDMSMTQNMQARRVGDCES